MWQKQTSPAFTKHKDLTIVPHVVTASNRRTRHVRLCQSCHSSEEKSQTISGSDVSGQTTIRGKKGSPSTDANMQYIECHKQKAEDKEGNSFASKGMGFQNETTDLNGDLMLQQTRRTSNGHERKVGGKLENALSFKEQQVESLTDSRNCDLIHSYGHAAPLIPLIQCDQKLRNPHNCSFHVRRAPTAFDLAGCCFEIFISR